MSKAGSSKSDLLSLPQELTDRIATCLPQKDKLRFTEANKSTRTTLVKGFRYEKLYLHPARLEDVISLLLSQAEFAKSLRETIEEVVIIGVSKPEMIVFPNEAQNRHLTYHYWPLHDTGQVPEDWSELKNLPSKPFKETYARLIKGLTEGLPRLHRITYADAVKQSLVGGSDGLCGVSQDFIEVHVRRCENECTQKLTKPEAFSNAVGSPVARWADLEVILGLMVALSPRFKYVNLEHKPRGAGTIRWWHLGPDAFDPRIHAGFHNPVILPPYLGVAGLGVEELKWTVPGSSLWIMFEEWMLQHCPNLRIFTVDFEDTGVDEAWRRRIGNEQGERQSEWNENPRQDLWPLICFTKGIARLNTLEQLSVICHDESPVCLRLEHLGEVLQEHKQSLRKVTLHNVIFDNHPEEFSEDGDFQDNNDDDNELDDTKQAMAKAVELLSDPDLRLTSVFLTVRRLGVDHRGNNSELTAEDRRQRYRDGIGNWFTLDCFDELANELGVSIGIEGWNFAERLVSGKGKHAG